METIKVSNEVAKELQGTWLPADEQGEESIVNEANEEDEPRTPPTVTEKAAEQSLDVEQPLPVDVEQLLGDCTFQEDDEMTRKWKESPFAVGLVKTTWRQKSKQDTWHFPLSVSRLVCGRAKRLGNMSVLYQKTSTDPPTAMAGPFWFVTLFITIPLIVGISLAVYFLYIRCRHNLGVIIAWAICVALLLICLVRASLSNPGIQLRYNEPQGDNWIWNDQALTYRPPGANYVNLCAVVVEEYDHVCPWVGTAIGKGNILWFRRFLWMLGICLAFNVAMILLGCG